jgi:hypothetical protein
MTFSCDYCSARINTNQGLRSHISQSAACGRKYFEANAPADAASDSGESVGSEVVDAGEIGEDFGDIALGSEGHPAISDDEMLDPPQQEDEPNNTDPASTPPAASPAKKRPRATVEEVEDEDDCWAQNFPEAAQAGAAYEACRTQFEKLRDEQKGAGKAPWSPFESEDQWELARWLMTAGISLKKTDAFLKLKTARTFIFNSSLD